MEITIYGQAYPAVEIAGEYYLARREVATLLKVGNQSLYRMRQQKKIEAYRLNGRLLFKAQEIVNIVAQKQLLTTAPVKPKAPKQPQVTGEQQ